MRKFLGKFLSLFFISLFIFVQVYAQQQESLPSDDSWRWSSDPDNYSEGTSTPNTNSPVKNPSSYLGQNNPVSSPISKVSTQNKISLDIKGMDVVDVLKMLANRANMNLVIGRNVSGRVTLFLKDVDVWDAFEIILLANDLAYERKGDIFNIMTQRDYELLYGERYRDKKVAKVVQLRYAKAADLSRSLNQIKTNIGRIVVDESSNTVALIDIPEKVKEMYNFIKKTDLPLKTEVFSLNYAQAEKITPKIQELLTKGVGLIRLDERTNKIAVTDYPSKLEEIAKIIQEFDEKTQQVLIDAQIVEVYPKDEFSMGVDWDFWLTKNFRMVGSFPAPTIASASSIPSAFYYGVAAANSSSQPAAKDQYKTIIDALRVIGETKILSSPRIMALNNQEAKILVGTKEAYITSTTSQTGTGSTVTSQTVNFVDVGLKLYVTATINKDKFITMKIRPEISSSETKTLIAEDKETQVPIVTTSETETTIMLKDGSTVMIAGLKRDKKEHELKKIPLLGDIPILGSAFRNVRKQNTKTELVVFITPHIVSGEESVSYSSLTKAKEIDFLESLTPKAPPLLPDINEPEPPNTQDYRWFVSEKIKRYCSSLRGISSLKGDIEVAFKLDSTGKLKGDPRVLYSNNVNLNSRVKQYIMEASPFPPFPSSLKKDEEEFVVRLTFE